MYKSRLLATVALAAIFLLVSVALITADTLTVTVPWANVGEGPGADYQVLTSLRRGSTFPILATKEDWHRIRFPDRREGWISGSIVGVNKERRGIAVDPASLPLATEQFYRSSWAVVIGIDRYPHPKIPSLRYAVNDARSVKAALQDLGFPSHQISVLLNEKATKRSKEEGHSRSYRVRFPSLISQSFGRLFWHQRSYQKHWGWLFLRLVYRGRERKMETLV